jgi:predicted alpha/beta-fold hydrolase
MKSSYHAPIWARSAHLQTLWGPLRRRLAPPPRRPEKRVLEDGDHIWLHWAGPEPAGASPVVILLHGLSGCADSPYAIGLQTALAEQGITSLVMNARGAGNRPNDRARSYHAGETGDLDQLIRTLHHRLPDAPLLAVGYSLGGSRLLNWLAEGGHPALRAAVAVSTPFMLDRCSSRLDQGFSRIYRRHLITQLLAQQARKLAHLRHAAPAEAAKLQALGDVSGIRSFREFDDRIIAPLHGYDGADDYYERCSSRPKLAGIRTPTLLLQAADDPFMTADTPPTDAELGPAMALELSRHGGHVGFVQGTPFRSRYWLEHRIPAFLHHWMH